MAAELVIAPEAELDIAEAYAWYEARRVGLGEDFLSSVDACMESIRRQPDMFPLPPIQFQDFIGCCSLRPIRTV